MTGKDDSTANGEPEEVTLKDLFRVMNTRFAEMRAEMNARFDQQDAEIINVKTELKAEIKAVRKTLDEDTATSREIANVRDTLSDMQSELASVKKTTADTAGQLRKLQSRIDRVGIPAE